MNYLIFVVVIFGFSASVHTQGMKGGNYPGTNTVTTHPIVIKENHFDHKYFQNSYVIFKDTYLTWMDAHIKCKKYGMELVSFKLQTEFDSLAEIIRRNDIPRANNQIPLESGAFWTSGNDLLREGLYTWLSTGEDVDYTLRKFNKPEPSMEQNCISVAKKLPQVYGLRYDNCLYIRRFICKK